MKMNARLRAYLRSLGLAEDATDEAAWEMYQGLRGLQASIANSLNYAEGDEQARTNCDLMIRSLGYDPQNPSKMLSDAGAGDDSDREEIRNQDDQETTRRQAAEQERARIRRIGELCDMAQLSADHQVRTQAINEGWSVEQMQSRAVELFRETTRRDVSPDVPAMHVRNSQTGHNRDSLAAAMMLRNGVSEDTILRSWPTVDSEGNCRLRDRTADESAMRAIDDGIGFASEHIVNIMARAAETCGIRVTRRTPVAIIDAIHAASYRSAVSQGTFVGLFSTAFTAMMMPAFDATDDTTRGWTIDRDVPNFLTNERTRMGKMGALQKLGKGGTAEHMDQGDVQETYKIFRYAGQFAIDEQDLVNDSFGRLQDHTPQQLGEAAAQIRMDLVYGTLLANAAMRDGTALFHTNHGNLETTAALAEDTLKNAISAMRVQTENGRNLNITPEYVIVPSKLEHMADELIKSPAVVIAGSTDRIVPTYNSLSRKGLKLVVDSRLDNGVTNPATGTAYSGSETTWFLSASGGNNTIEVGHLRGTNRRPRVRAYMFDRGQYGIGFDVSYDIGAKALDWRGMVKNTA